MLRFLGKGSKSSGNKACSDRSFLAPKGFQELVEKILGLIRSVPNQSCRRDRASDLLRTPLSVRMSISLAKRC
jgi:hypothetical protein